ncbi:MAG TPA: MFS transporter [Streptosporangiaceae bacterium]
MTAADTTAGFDREQWSALLVCLAGGFVVFLDVSIVNVALPTISSHLHASGSGLQWIVSGYALAFGLLLVPAGRLGDIHGHRMLFVAGLAVFGRPARPAARHPRRRSWSSGASCRARPAAC